jgi:hypothetical protein
MATITPPAILAQLTSGQLTLSTNQRVNAAPFGGSEQAVDLLNDRWLCTLSLPPNTQANAAQLEAFIAAMRGQTNTVNLAHPLRKAPRGTMRGTLTLSAAAAQGAASISITGGAGQAGTTLLAGDLLGVGGLLLMVAADATANGSGVITVTLANRLRVAQASAAAVTWSAPTVPMRLLQTSGVQYQPGYAGSISLDFAEAI